jgi:hypothetical protein
MRRTLLALAAILVTATAVPGHAAAPQPHIVDPKGDAITEQAGHDIVSVRFSTTKRMGKVSHIVVTATFAAAPSREPGVLYRVLGNHSACGGVMLSWAPASALAYDQVYMHCGSSELSDGTGPYTIVNVRPRVSGSVMTWTLALKALPKEMAKGTMTDLAAFTTISDPVFGIFNATDYNTAASIDYATGTGSFKY